MILGWLCLVWAVLVLVRVFNGLRNGLHVMTRPAVVMTLSGRSEQQYVRLIIVNIVVGLTSTTLLALAGLTLIGVLS